MSRNLKSMAMALCFAAVAVGVAAGSPLNRKISGDLPDYADLYQHQDVTISPDSRYVVYASDERVDEFYEVYSVPLNGSGGPVRISGPTQTLDNSALPNWKISPDSQRVVYSAKESRLTSRQLFSVPIAGGPKVQLSPAEPISNWVDDFLISPNSERVVLSTDQGIFSIPIEGGKAVRLAADNTASPQITADSKTVMYLQYDTSGTPVALYSVPITGGSPIQISQDQLESWKLYEDAGGSPRVAFFARDEMDIRSLFTVPASGGAPERITSQIGERVYQYQFIVCENGETAVFESGTDSGRPTLSSVSLSAGEPITLAVDSRMDGYNGSRFVVSPDCSSVVYGLGDSLFVAPVAGSSTSRVSYVCGPTFIFSPDSRHMMYSGRESLERPCEIWVLDLTTKSSALLSAPLPSGGAVSRQLHRITPDGHSALYVAEQQTVGVAELFMASLAGTQTRKLSGPMIFGGNVTVAPIVSPDGRYVVYVADQERDEVHELFATTLTGEEGAHNYLPLVQR